MTVPAVAEAWYDELQVAQPGDTERGAPLLTLLGALGVPFSQLHDLVRDTPDGPGWSPLFDPDRCPDWALPWLAQAVGVTTRGKPLDVLRAEVRDVPRFRRGTAEAMTAAAQTTLTGDRTVRLLERDSSEYHLTVVTRTAETPDAASTLAAIKTQKPAGLIVQHIVSDAPLINEFTRTIDAITAPIDSLTLADVT